MRGEGFPIWGYHLSAHYLRGQSVEVSRGLKCTEKRETDDDNDIKKRGRMKNPGADTLGLESMQPLFVIYLYLI
jgi:hypothetical protein